MRTIGPAVSEKKIFEFVDDDGWTTDGHRSMGILQVGFFKKKPMKRSAAVCYKRFPFALDSSVVDSLVRH